MVACQISIGSLFDQLQRGQTHYLFLRCRSPRLQDLQNLQSLQDHQSPQGHQRGVGNMAQVEGAQAKGVLARRVRAKEVQEREVQAQGVHSSMIGVPVLQKMAGLKKVELIKLCSYIMFGSSMMQCI